MSKITKWSILLHSDDRYNYIIDYYKGHIDDIIKISESNNFYLIETEFMVTSLEKSIIATYIRNKKLKSILKNR